MKIENEILKQVQEKDIVNGEFYFDKLITSIGKNAFQCITSLERINIPQTITSIGKGAFNYCRCLKSIQLPDELQDIGDDAFFDCRELETITLPKELTRINSGMFNNCLKLKEVNISEEVTSIGDNAFSGCREIKTIQIPENVTEIGKSVFYGCINLEEIKLPKEIIKIDESTFSYCRNLKQIQIPENVTCIESNAFYNCANLMYVELPKGLKIIQNDAFQECKKLVEIKIPETVTSMGNNIFYNCTNLKEIEISQGITSIGDFSFYGCENLKRIILPKGILYIGNNAFEKCGNLKEIKIPEGVVTINSGAFKYCRSLEEIILPESVTNIGFNAFGYCRNLKQIQIPENIKNIDSNIFEDCKFLERIIRTINGEKVIIDTTNIIGKNLNIQDKENFFICSKLSEKLNKNNIKFYDIFVNSLLENEKNREICKNIDFKTFKSNIPDINELLYKQPKEEQIDFYKFAMVLGCFNPTKILNKKGEKTQTSISQKACTLLAQLLKTEEMKIGNYHQLFTTLPINTEVNQKLINFLSPTGNGKERTFENLKTICSFEKEMPGAFVKFLINFEKIKECKTTINEQGIQVNLSWKQAFKKYINENTYVGVTKENEDIAKIFSSKGISQETFNKATELRRQAISNNIPEHILGKHIKERTLIETLEDEKNKKDCILDEIEQIKSETNQSIKSSKGIIDELYNKQFTYEWLSKKDPRNSIMGIYCNCCATIESPYFGRHIAKATIVEPNVQNIIIKDINEKVIAKGTMYVNKDKGVAVINDFELNSKYRKHEKTPGIYTVLPDSKEEQERQLIFNAFMRGILKFVEEYDIQYPNNPIKQINVGVGYNRLKRQVEQMHKQFKENNNILLEVPIEYGFNDTKAVQKILYKRESVKENNINKDER